jgi:dihydroorotase
MPRAPRRLPAVAPAATPPTPLLELYAEAFEQVGALDKLEAFASFNGPDWYGLPRNSGTVTLLKENWTVPADYPYITGDSIVPLRAGETLSWKML